MLHREIRTLQSIVNLRIFSILMWWIVRTQFLNHLYVFPFRCLESTNQTKSSLSTENSKIRKYLLTWRYFNPPNFTVIWMLDELASKLFSMSSFNAFAGRRIISPAAMRFTTTASSFLITPGSNSNLPSILLNSNRFFSFIIIVRAKRWHLIYCEQGAPFAVYHIEHWTAQIFRWNVKIICSCRHTRKSTTIPFEWMTQWCHGPMYRYIYIL